MRTATPNLIKKTVAIVPKRMETITLVAAHSNVIRTRAWTTRAMVETVLKPLPSLVLSQNLNQPLQRDLSQLQLSNLNHQLQQVVKLLKSPGRLKQLLPQLNSSESQTTSSKLYFNYKKMSNKEKLNRICC